MVNFVKVKRNIWEKILGKEATC